MDTQILIGLLAKRIDINKFHVRTVGDILWSNPADDTPENRAIVQNVIDNYDKLATEYEPERLSLEVDAKRRAAYREEADPLFFKAQRGEATIQEWQDKVEEIRERYPRP